MIWLKRLLPFVIIIVAYYGYGWYQERNTTTQIETDDRYALAVAQIWVGSAKHHDEPERFLEYRDSIMEAAGLRRSDLRDYIDGYQNQAENLVYFSERLKHYVDSLYLLEDSLRMERDTLKLDLVM